jgi:S1-C subfamily serine protease
MEGLTKQQLILLALLVSFVTSIATGIFTVSLMEKAPPAITQTINRVVEKTIERVVPAQNQAAVVTKETVIVKSDDMVVATVDRNSKSLVRIREVLGDSEPKTENTLAIGAVSAKDGLLVSDIDVLVKRYYDGGNMIPKSYLAVLPDGAETPISPVGVDEENGLVFFRAVSADGGKILSGLPPVSFGNSDNLKLGQAVVLIGGEDSNAVSTSIISALDQKTPEGDSSASSTPTAAKTVTLIHSDFKPVGGFPGAVLANLSSEVVGFELGRAIGSRGVYLPANVVSLSITKFLASEAKAVKKTQ